MDLLYVGGIAVFAALTYALIAACAALYRAPGGRP